MQNVLSFMQPEGLWQRNAASGNAMQNDTFNETCRKAGECGMHEPGS